MSVECKHCHGPMPVERLKHRGEYCSDSCKDKANRQRRSAREYGQNGSNCVICGRALHGLYQRTACSLRCAAAIHSDNPNYKDELRTELQRLWLLTGDEYLTANQIGARLGIGKNVVEGMRRRLELPPRENPALKPKQHRPPQQPRLPFPTQQAAALASRPPAPAPRPVVRLAQVKILPARECQFIAADDKPFHICGAPTWKRPEKERSSYCEAHHRVCYFPSARQEYAA